MAKKITMKKLGKVAAPEDFQAEGVVAFQLVEFTVDFYGSVVTDTLDTKIMADGSQLVIGGNGFVPGGYLVA